MGRRYILWSIIVVGVIGFGEVFAKEHKEPLKSVVVDIKEEMKLYEDNNRMLGESPVYEGEARVEVSGVPSSAEDDYRLGIEVKVYEDKACEHEIREGFNVDWDDEGRRLNGVHTIHVRVEPKTTLYAGNEVYVKLYAKLEKTA